MDTFTIITVMIGLILTIVGIGYAKKTFKKDYIEKPNEEKLHLLAQFKATQNLSRSVYTDLHSYVAKYNALDQFMWPGITYETYLSELRSQTEDGNLSDKQYKALENMKEIPSMTLQSWCKSLETQFESLNLIHTEVKLKTKNKL